MSMLSAILRLGLMMWWLRYQKIIEVRQRRRLREARMWKRMRRMMAVGRTATREVSWINRVLVDFEHDTGFCGDGDLCGVGVRSRQAACCRDAGGYRCEGGG